MRATSHLCGAVDSSQLTQAVEKVTSWLFNFNVGGTTASVGSGFRVSCDALQKDSSASLIFLALYKGEGNLLYEAW